MNDPTLSCVIPTHGRPDFLRDAIASVLAQTHPVDEIVVVSDDGDETTAAVVSEFAKSAVPVRLVANTSSPGASGSRNLGARNSQGNWIAFLDDDDLWAPTYLEEGLAIAHESAASVVVSWLEMFRGDDRAPAHQIQPGLTADGSGARNPGLTGSNVLVRRAEFDQLGGFDEKLRVLNDIDFCYRMLQQSVPYAVNPRFSAFQRKHGEGQLTKASQIRADGVKQYIEKHRSTLSRSELRTLQMKYWQILYHLASNPVRKAWYFVRGLANANPGDVVKSLRNRGQRHIWRG